MGYVFLLLLQGEPVKYEGRPLASRQMMRIKESLETEKMYYGCPFRLEFPRGIPVMKFMKLSHKVRNLLLLWCCLEYL